MCAHKGSGFRGHFMLGCQKMLRLKKNAKIAVNWICCETGRKLKHLWVKESSCLCREKPHPGVHISSKHDPAVQRGYSAQSYGKQWLLATHAGRILWFSPFVDHGEASDKPFLLHSVFSTADNHFILYVEGFFFPEGYT